ncbi:MAG: effector-associated domain EAD1-containing protein [Caldilineaceae bacterium]
MASLSQMVRKELNENLEEITTADDLRTIVFSLIAWAEQTSRIEDLVRGAFRANPSNLALQQLVSDVEFLESSGSRDDLRPQPSPNLLIVWAVLTVAAVIIISGVSYLIVQAQFRVLPQSPSMPSQVAVSAEAAAETTVLPNSKVCTFPVSAAFKPLWDMYKDSHGCATGIVTTIPKIAEQSFQGGHMFWRSDTDDVYIIYDRQMDGSDRYMGEWEAAWPDWKWDGSYPDGLHLVPPPKLHEPIRGFGWVWRKYLDGAEGKLGWALDKEYGWENRAIVQPFEQGLIFRGSAPKIYLLLGSKGGKFFAQS